MTYCAYHPDAESVAFCVACGKALCGSCRRDVEGSVYCESCLGKMVRTRVGAQSSGAEAGARREKRPESVAGENPGAAFALGLIPGVGAIYNGEFFKAAVHIVIFAFLVSLADVGGPAEPIFALLGVGFFFYMPFEAYYTAKKRKLLSEGIDLETPIDRFHQQFGEIENKEFWGGVVLVALGVIFLADNFRVLPLRDVLRFWPVALIALGVWLVWNHRELRGTPPSSKESSHSEPSAEAPEEGERPV